MNCVGEVAAFFDLDGTLLPPPSLEMRFVRYALGRGELGPVQLLRWAVRFMRDVALDPRSATQGNKAHFGGVSVGAVQRWGQRLAARPLEFFSAGLRLLQWHAVRGHRIFLVTGAPLPLAGIAASRLPVPVGIIATQLEQRDGLWTGGISGEHLSCEAKRRAIECLAQTTGIDLERSFAYGNSYSDVAMLESVAFPTAVNPTELLERLAHRRGWPVLEWHATEVIAQTDAIRATDPFLNGHAAILSIVHPTIGANR